MEEDKTKLFFDENMIKKPFEKQISETDKIDEFKRNYKNLYLKKAKEIKIQKMLIYCQP